MWGPLAGLGAFVEVQWKDSFYMDNANLLKAPGYELVNLNVHYNTDLKSDYFKSLSMYAEVRNVFDRTYVASANNIGKLGHGCRHSKCCERAGEHDRLDLRRLAARVHGGNKAGVQMIGQPCRRSKAMLRMSLLATLAFSLCQTAAQAQMSHHQHASEAACEEVELRCASKVTPAFASDGTLWLAWMAGGQISVASSKDQGRSFSTPVQVTKEKLKLDWGPDARPQIVVEKNGGIALAFSIFRDKAFNGQVLATRSIDGGQSFAELQPITANNESQRFAALGLDADGSVFAAWIDKRNRVPAQQEGRKYEGAGLFFASSKDGGAAYAEARLASDNTCECCRLGLAFAGPGRPVRGVQEHLRRRRAGSRGHDVHRSGDAGRGSPRQQRRLADFRVPASWPQSFDLAGGHLSREPGTPTARPARGCSMPARRTRAVRFPIRFRSAAPTATRRGRTC